ncbi:pyridoxamine 5'-phosphate oxidase family protein [Pseudodesulfovibrio sp. zrk46]|uniref:pyridoxamine 5'-phosphate oxidase family protein n=1 Tax=Pseudodesulfovibrio sp. zrk46 TaxID=2725288 RepID=UPI0014497E31|nr:pyridoxamine 5'-phosphate oxidase family protein [Pseudodesulfovibrio sp. zrk46]QJB57215.1 pyridoxamine 5'-phosphate oxidase family protein [Pseudodesulfovibrio sp. zrk46]
MKRSEKEISDIDAIKDIIHRSEVMRLGLCKEGMPYVVPLSFGYDGNKLFFHCAKEGMKTDYLNANNKVCFEFEQDVAIDSKEKSACAWGMHFKSVIGFGVAEEIMDAVSKNNALQVIMSQYSDKEWELPEKAVAATSVWAISIESMTGKQG